jgi:hypothetical protein
VGADEGEAEQGQSGGARVHRGKRAVIARVDSASGSARALCVSDILSDPGDASTESVVETHIRSRTGTFVGAAQVPKERSSALLEGAF